MSKLLSIIVPAYNSEDYIERCVNSLLVGGKRAQIILVDDGSTDRTPEIMDGYAKSFPNQIEVLHEKNSGHGGAINNGLKLVKTKYVKVVDSDDWLDFEGFQKMLDFLEGLEHQHQELDMIISNYVYNKVNAKRNHVIAFKHLPTGRVFDWDEVDLRMGQYLMTHALIYRTSILVDEAKLQLPTNVSYDDNIYVFEPLRYVHRMYYVDIDLYHYFIGRNDQSVNENVMLKKIDQQLMINKRMIKYYGENIDMNTPLGRYMRYYLEIITTISSVILIRQDSPYYTSLKDELWEYLKSYDSELYKKLRHRPLGIGVNFNGKLGRKLVSGLYRLAHKIYQFN
ncbi:glycosyltransferase involved in cell wall biosynthesis [Lactobacillus colini]|uniref:Glycosyltransferase involved in cell wall biosynthesis n=1 Tax=Lactobacillus colini TaxID=1819254 RepID=A0ABS4MC69_9LACO|nr:glycosyltransferase family 2 protein [Lactobacillus colini]MBP2056941.1 glycosyltransferase involved in cell wall biosynthesis [Lactobacillus colini]